MKVLPIRGITKAYNRQRKLEKKYYVTGKKKNDDFSKLLEGEYLDRKTSN